MGMADIQSNSIIVLAYVSFGVMNDIPKVLAFFNKPVQYGINIEVLDQASDGSWGRIAVYNQSVEFDTTGTAEE